MDSRIALIGCGYWGKNIGRTLAELGALACVVDGDSARADAFAADFGTTTSSVERLLADDRIDAVAIATPASTHFELATTALRAGKDVFVEKPMALHPRHGEEMVAVAAEEDRVLMVGHLLQYHPAFLALQEIIADGQLGRLQYLYSNRLNFGKIRREEDVLWSFAPHDLSMILSLAGEVPSEMRTEGHFLLHGRIADVTTTHLSFASGLAGHVFVSWLHPVKEQRLVVIGERGMAVFDDLQPHGQKLARYEAQVEWLNGQPVAPKAAPLYVDVSADEPLRNELSHFIECVETRNAPKTDGQEGLRVLEVLTEASGQLLGRTAQPQSQTMGEGEVLAIEGVHPTACIDEGVEIGAGTKIWHFSHIMPNTTIGPGCSLGQNVVAGPNVRIGSGVKIQNNVSVYDGVTLEDDVFCGPSMVFTNVTTPRSFVSRADEFAPTLVKRGASIGANATVVCGSTIGQFAFVAAGAVVTKDVADHALMVGVPARQIGWVSREGEVLDESLVCPRTGEVYELVDGALKLKVS